MLILATVAQLSGCQTLKMRVSSMKAVTRTDNPLSRQDDLQGLIRFAAWLNQQSPKSQARIAPDLALRATTPGTVADRIRLALLFGLPDSPFSDTWNARYLLEAALARSKSNRDGLHEFAGLLLANLNERTQLLDTMTHQVEVERDARNQLQHKLDELKTLEEQLAKREIVRHTDPHD